MFFSFSAFFPPPGQPSSTRYDDRPPYNYESQHTSYPTSYPDTSSSSWDRYSSHSLKAINLYFWLFLNIGFNFRFVEIYVTYFNMIKIQDFVVIHCLGFIEFSPFYYPWYELVPVFWMKCCFDDRTETYWREYVGRDRSPARSESEFSRSVWSTHTTPNL